MRFEYAYQEFNELLQAQMFTVGIDFFSHPTIRMKRGQYFP